MEPARALQQIAFHLERTGAPTYRVRGFRNAARMIGQLTDDELTGRVRAGTLMNLPTIGKATAAVVAEAVAGREPEYLRTVRERPTPTLPEGGALAEALRGDCHTHSDWSDGASPPHEMAEAARQLGHEWMVLTDHSPRLTIANGLSAERLRAQLDSIAELNASMAPFRMLTGIEVDILADGGLDQDADLLAQLDCVVASVHSGLRMPAEEMTERMLGAIHNPLVTVLGHCTGRLVTGKGRDESSFDAEAVFGACREHDVAVEINCRPDRLDPPRRLLRVAQQLGCHFAIDTDAHAPGQLSWQPYGCARATECGVPAERVINTGTAEDLLAWAGRPRC